MDKLNGEDCTICRPATNAPEFKQVGGMDKRDVQNLILDFIKPYMETTVGSILMSDIDELTAEICQLYKLKLPENLYSLTEEILEGHPTFSGKYRAFSEALQQVKEDNPHLEVE